MNLLALESSTQMVSVALWRDGAVTELAENLPNSGSQHLLPWCSALLRAAGIGTGDVDAVAFGSGPGGFVGLRLACGVGQGLSVGLGVPVVGVSTLEALALASGGSDVYVCTDARMGEIYAAAYRVRAGVPETVVPPGVFAASAVPLPPAGNWSGAGSGFKAHGVCLRQRLDGLLGEICADVYPTAAAVARIAALRLTDGASGDAADAIPTYIRDSVALTTAERIAKGGAR